MKQTKYIIALLLTLTLLLSITTIFCFSYIRFKDLPQSTQENILSELESLDTEVLAIVREAIDCVLSSRSDYSPMNNSSFPINTPAPITTPDPAKNNALETTDGIEIYSGSYECPSEIAPGSYVITVIEDDGWWGYLRIYKGDETVESESLETGESFKFTIHEGEELLLEDASWLLKKASQITF